MKKNIARLMIIFVFCSILGASVVSVKADSVDKLYEKKVFEQNLLQSNVVIDSYLKMNSCYWSVVRQTINPKIIIPNEGSVLCFNSNLLENGEFGALKYDRSIRSDCEWVSITFDMYHDSGEKYSEDGVYPVVWDSNGYFDPDYMQCVLRYSPTEGWLSHTFKIEYPKDEDFSVGLLGYSESGNNIYISKISISKIYKDLNVPTAPRITISNSTRLTNQPVTVTINVGKDTESGVNRTEYRYGDNDSWKVYSSPLSVGYNTKIEARTIDNVGNISKSDVREIKNIDTDAPQIAIKTVVDAVDVLGSCVTNKDVFISISDAQVGGQNVYLNGEPIPWDSTFTTEGDYEVVAMDFAGNTAKQTFTIDKTPPKIIVKAANGKKISKSSKVKTKKAVISATDKNIFGNTIKYKNKTTSFSKTKTVKAKGKYTIKSVDKAGNVKTFSFTIK